ncbi:MAG: colanic acid/amylovoran biosynthesis protein [Chthoniobacter sp.]|nr:colanic acid/amylovoran biosynthesis protein [Chthoniobacter sp.]
MGTPVGSGNRGVLALGASLVNLCCEASGGGGVFLLLVNREGQPVPFRVAGLKRLIPIVNARMSLRSWLRDHLAWIGLMSLAYWLSPSARMRLTIARKVPWIKAVADADLVGDVRGGDSFSDIYGLERFVLAFLPVLSVLLIKGTMVQFPQTFGPFKNPLARLLAKFILRRSSVIIARDTRSQAAAQELLGPGQAVMLSPDVAFSLEVIRPKTIELDPPRSGSVPPGIIGVNVNGLMYRGGYTQANMFGLKMDYVAFLRELVPALLKEHPGEIWLIPHTYAPDGNLESDLAASRAVRDSAPAELRPRIRIVTREYDQHELKGIIGQCDFFIGSRMHSCIAALSQGIPCVGVAYSMKFAGVFESVGMKDWVVDGREVDADEAIERIIQLHRQRDEVRENLWKRAEEARARLKEVFKMIMVHGVSSRIAENAA